MKVGNNGGQQWWPDSFLCYISKAFWHYQPLKRSVLSLESGFPFVSFSNAYEVIRMLEIDFGVDSCVHLASLR